MSQRVLVVVGADHTELFRTDVLSARMVNENWMLLEIVSNIPEYERPTTTWYRLPPAAAFVELQDHVVAADFETRTKQEGTTT